MKLATKDGKMVLTLNGYGAEWAMTFVNGGCDEAMIDTGDSSAFDDFQAYLATSDLSPESVAWLVENFFEDRNWAIEVEDGAEEALLENGYIKNSQYYFTLKEKEDDTEIQVNELT